MDDDEQDYVPYAIDPMPCMSFSIWYYDKDGYLQRPWFYYHSLRDTMVREDKHGLWLSFSSDSRAIVLRGNEVIHTIAEALADCRLSEINVHDERKWPLLDPTAPRVEIIMVQDLKRAIQRNIEPDDFELPGEKPLS